MNIFSFFTTDNEEDDKLPTSVNAMSGPERLEMTQEVLTKMGIVTRWDEACAKPIKNRTIVYIIGDVVAAETSFGTLKKESLEALCTYLGIPHRGQMSNREMRSLIAEECGFEYQSPDSNIRCFRKKELQQIVMNVLEAKHCEYSL